jgi:molecular chaperone GrpE (heat shock protein)
MFATDWIKRLDLIDVLIQRFSEGGNAALAQQLTTLRASFEDILHQHGVTEFEVAPGTVVDVALRYKIAITDSVPGKSKPKVIESYRPGYIYSSPEGKETILRKVEVKTSSQ